MATREGRLMWDRIRDTIDSLIWLIVLAIGVAVIIWMYYAFATVGVTRGTRGG